MHYFVFWYTRKHCLVKIIIFFENTDKLTVLCFGIIYTRSLFKQSFFENTVKITVLCLGIIYTTILCKHSFLENTDIKLTVLCFGIIYTRSIFKQ